MTTSLARHSLKRTLASQVSVEESCEKLTATAERQKSILLELVADGVNSVAAGETHGENPMGKPWKMM